MPPSALRRTRPSSSANVGSPEQSVRSTRMFRKNPISSSSSGLTRPATGTPTTHVLRPGVAGQDHLEPGQQDHEQRRPVRPADGPQPVGYLGGNRERHRSGPVTADHRPWPVQGQIQQHRRTRPAASASTRSVRPADPLQPPPLPHRPVRVLRRQRRQRRRLTSHGSPVQFPQVSGRYPQRPAVGDDVVHASRTAHDRNRLAAAPAPAATGPTSDQTAPGPHRLSTPCAAASGSGSPVRSVRPTATGSGG